MSEEGNNTTAPAPDELEEDQSVPSAPSAAELAEKSAVRDMRDGQTGRKRRADDVPSNKMVVNQTKNEVSIQSAVLNDLVRDLQLGDMKDAVKDQGGRASDDNVKKVYFLSPSSVHEEDCGGQILIIPAVPKSLLLALQLNITEEAFLEEFDRSAYFPHNDTTRNTSFWYSFKSTDVKTYADFYEARNNDPDDVGRNNVMYARALDDHRPERCPVLSLNTKAELSNLVHLVNQGLKAVFPQMRQDLKQANNKDDILPGVNRPVIDPGDDGLERALKEGPAMLEKDDEGNETGCMDKGHHGAVEMIFGLFRTKKETVQRFHFDCKYARKRAEILESQGRLAECSYQVGYILVVPLSFEGCRLDYIVTNKTGQKVAVQKRIPFGSGMLIRLDVFHAGGYGSCNNWRVLATFLTPKSAYYDEGAYFDDVYPDAELVYRGGHQTSCMKDFWGEKSTGDGNRLQHTLLKAYWQTNPSIFVREKLLSFKGFDGLWSPEAIKETFENSPNIWDFPVDMILNLFWRHTSNISGRTGANSDQSKTVLRRLVFGANGSVERFENLVAKKTPKKKQELKKLMSAYKKRAHFSTISEFGAGIIANPQLAQKRYKSATREARKRKKTLSQEDNGNEDGKDADLEATVEDDGEQIPDEETKMGEQDGESSGSESSDKKTDSEEDDEEGSDSEEDAEEDDDDNDGDE